jgi:hypothetical protein
MHKHMLWLHNNHTSIEKPQIVVESYTSPHVV